MKTSIIFALGRWGVAVWDSHFSLAADLQKVNATFIEVHRLHQSPLGLVIRGLAKNVSPSLKRAVGFKKKKGENTLKAGNSS